MAYVWSTSSPHTMANPEGGPEVHVIDGVKLECFETWEDLHEFTRCEQASRPSTTMLQIASENKASTSASSAFVSSMLDKYLNQTKKELEELKYPKPVAPPEGSKIYDEGILAKECALRKSQLPKVALPKVTSTATYIPPKVPLNETHQNEQASTTFIRRVGKGKKVKTSLPLPKRRKICMSSKKYGVSTQHHHFLYNFKKRNGDASKKSPKKIINDDDMMIPDDLMDTPSPLREEAYLRLCDLTLKDLKARRKPLNVSIIMDETYVTFALEALEGPTTVQSVGPEVKPAKKGRKRKSDLKDEDFISKSKKDESEVIATMISRHSRRDIKLPARYNNSGVMMGNHWTLPEDDDSPIKEVVKIPRKSLKEMQGRLMKLRLPSVPDSLRTPKKVSTDPHVPKKRGRPPNKTFVVKSGQMATLQEVAKFAAGLVPRPGPLNMVITRTDGSSASGQYFFYTPSPDQEPQAITQVPPVAASPTLPKDPQICPRMRKQKNKRSKINDPSTTSTEPPTLQERRVSLPKTLEATTEPSTSSFGHFIMKRKKATKEEAIPVANNSPNESLTDGSPSEKLTELRELYRNLFYTCRPERKSFFQSKGVKPRLNKQLTVVEAIEVIKKQQATAKQLQYIHKLLILWNHKLELCSKVISNKVQPDSSTTDKSTTDVVKGVLDAYQKSVCVQICNRLDQGPSGLGLRRSSATSTSSTMTTTDGEDCPPTRPTKCPVVIYSSSTDSRVGQPPSQPVLFQPTAKWNFVDPLSASKPFPPPPPLINGKEMVVGPRDDECELTAIPKKKGKKSSQSLLMPKPKQTGKNGVNGKKNLPFFRKIECPQNLGQNFGSFKIVDGRVVPATLGTEDK